MTRLRTSLVHVLGTPKADVPVASAGIAGEAASEGARELIGRHIEHMIAAARDARARDIRILPAVRRVVGIGPEQAAGPFGLVARKIEHALGRRAFRMVADRIGLATTATEDCMLGRGRCFAPGIGAALLATGGRFPLGFIRGDPMSPPG